MAKAMQATTPTFSLILPDGIDLSGAENAYVTFRQGVRLLTKTGDELDVGTNQVDVYLSQAETLQFRKGVVEIQLNWTYSGGQRAATTVVEIDWKENLLQRVVS